MNKKLATGIQVALGFLLGIVLNALFVSVGSLLVPYGLILIGVVQLVWQLPVILLLRRKGHKSVALGVVIAASITALLNATCWVLLESGKIK
jgi:hypothetical protein